MIASSTPSSFLFLELEYYKLITHDVPDVILDQQTNPFLVNFLIYWVCYKDLGSLMVAGKCDAGLSYFLEHFSLFWNVQLSYPPVSTGVLHPQMKSPRNTVYYLWHG